jgi:phage gp46-like protein
MPSIRLIQKVGLTELSIDTVFAPKPGPDFDVALARAVMVALNTDRLALPDDTLPNDRDDDRRGWWGDLNADTIWGGWPIGTRLWLMVRDKITGSNAKQGATIARATTFINEALQPFVDARIFSRFAVSLQVVGTSKVTGTITIYRGPKSSIALAYEDVWAPYGG